MMMRLLKLSLVATAGLSIAAITASAAPQPERLRGIVTAVTGDEVTVHTATGDVSMSVSGDTKYLTTVHAEVKNITADSYIGVATKDVGGKQAALDIIIFPSAMKGAAEGHFGWDRMPDTTLAGGAKTASSMTNGSVAAVAQGGSGGATAATANSSMTNGSVAAASESGGAKQLTITYKGGEQRVLVPPTASIVTMQFGALSDIKPGVGVFVNAVADGGKTAAGLIIVGTQGAVPPI
jgi:hypothetical protein